MQGKSSKKLSAQMERYCKLRATGADPLDAMERAGYALDQSADRRTLIKRANSYDRNPMVQDRLAELKEEMALLEGEQATGFQPHMFKELELSGEGGNVSMGWVNQAAYTVYKQALSVDNFHQGLLALKFIAELNGYMNKPSPGRPRGDKTPNDGETGFNHDTGADTSSPEEDAGFALEFEEPVRSSRKKSADARAAADDVRANSRKSASDVEDDDDGFDDFN